METAATEDTWLVETFHLVGGLSFLVRARRKAGGGLARGWMWAAHAEGHPWAEADLRGWYSAEAAEAAALRRLEKLFGDGGEG